MNWNPNIRLERLLPARHWWPKVNRNSARADLLAGLTNAIIVLPQGVAFALIAGLPPEYGLYTAMVTPVIAALFGSSWHLISGPTTAISIVVFASISGFAEPGSPDFIRLALALTVMAGAFQLLMGLAKLGRLVNFVSHTVIVGFTTGAALLIAASQLRHVLGVDFERGSNLPETLWHVADKIHLTQWPVLLVATITLLTAIGARAIHRRAPHLMLGMLVGSIAAAVLAQWGYPIATVAALPGHLPPPAIPDLSLNTLRDLAPSALAIGLLGLIEAVSISRAISTRSRQRIDSNQEFIGQGLSNFVGGFFSAYAGSGSFTRSGVNYDAGAQTPLSAIFAASWLAMILVFVAPLSAYLPYAAMGGVIMLVAWNLVHFDEIAKIFRAGSSEFWILLITFFSTLFFELEFAVYAGVLLSLVLYLNRTARPKMTLLAPNPHLPKRRLSNVFESNLAECPQLAITTLNGSAFFGATEHIKDSFEYIRRRDYGQKHLMMLCDGINFVDLAGAETLAEEAISRRENAGALVLVGVKGDVEQALHHFKTMEAIDEHNIFGSKKDAISETVDRLDPDICARCIKRVFNECNWRPRPEESN